MLWRRKRDATGDDALTRPADRVPEADTGELKIKPQAGPDRIRGAWQEQDRSRRARSHSGSMAADDKGRIGAAKAERVG